MKKNQGRFKELSDIVSKEYPKLKKINSNLSEEEFKIFFSNFYSISTNHELKTLSADKLYLYALENFKIFNSRSLNDITIKIYNPDQKSGLEASSTIIDIINKDVPFLVDSVVAFLDQHGIKIKRIMHPIYYTKRQKDNKLLNIDNCEDDNKSFNQESIMQLHVEKIGSEEEVKIIYDNLKKILDSVHLVVGDWKKMLDLAENAKSQIENAQNLTSDIEEIKEFISWIIDGNVILLGAKEFDITKNKDGEYHLVEANQKSFGIFRSKYHDIKPFVLNTSFEEVSESVDSPYIIEILKSRYKSKIHRIANAERIRIQKISKEGKIIGEYRFVGLFTSAAYNEPTKYIPLIRKKVSKVIKNSDYIKGSHNYKDLVSILESYPRDELFQISEKDLLKNATGIVAIMGRSEVRFFAREDKYSRFVSCIIYVPRTKHNSELRNKITSYLSEIYNAEVADYYIQTNDSNLVRIHVIVRTNNEIPKINEIKIEKEIANMTVAWSDELCTAIKDKFDNKDRINLFARYKNVFSVSYQNRFSSKQAASDIRFIEKCLNEDETLFNLYQSSKVLPDNITELKIYSPEKEIILSEIMPFLENYGFDIIKEHTYVVNIEVDGTNGYQKAVWIHYFHINFGDQCKKFDSELKTRFEESISLNWKRILDVKFLNKLTIGAGLSWKQIFMLYAYKRYLKQIGLTFDNLYFADVLAKYTDITKLLVNLFEIKFDPTLKLSLNDRNEKVLNISNQILEKLSAVNNINDDSIIRGFYSLIMATLRTNYYQHNDKGEFKGYISYKFDCAKIPNLPLPIPFAEIFVCSAGMEGTHLRGGKVARGGLRWSDRKQDFRTEVLGLMKAQMTKNAVIVPVGSKGCFVVNKYISELSREEAQAEAIKCYKTFLRGILDLTDNIVNNRIKNPENMVIYDKEDPYLVVAADKGTATFSDIANSVSGEYDFWLGDAFASGGSVGYDHKKMGITAKGAWVSVKRHFAEMGHDTQSQDFTCVGIGDMGGDVFGNGMLLSKHIQLVAAFNHMHIFLDPNPDSAASYKERKRMFNLPRSTWEDYNPSLISKGGGVFSRSSKTIKISPEIAKSLSIEEGEMSPNELIQAILKAPVDLLWNGGIGTYVKSQLETDNEAGDRANDSLRVNGKDLRCKVVGEGGNLGLTQKGRIEFALNGGRVNTDAMDNSAGVDCSDHEVNIKIALAAALRDDKISLKERNKVLESMTDEVSDLVLYDNYLQTLAISIAQSQKEKLLDDQSQFMDRLDKDGLLNKRIEFLPSKKEIEKRRADGVGLVRPELCVILSYAKMEIYNKLLSSKLIKDKYFEKELISYFPKLMQDKFQDQILNHQLRDEIIATQITNFVVNRLGITFVGQLSRYTGFDIVDIVKNFIVACDSFRLREVWEDIESLDGKVSSKIQMEMFLGANKLIERSIIWLLRNPTKGNINSNIERFRKIADDLFKVFPNVLAKASRESFERKIECYNLNKVDKKLASKIAALDPAASAFDIAEICSESNFDLPVIAKIYFEVGTRFSLKWLRNKILSLPTHNHWQRLSNKSILDELYYYQLNIAKEIVKHKDGKKDDFVENWIKKVGVAIENYDKFISELKANPDQDLSVFIVASNRLKSLLN